MRCECLQPHAQQGTAQHAHFIIRRLCGVGGRGRKLLQHKQQQQQRQRQRPAAEPDTAEVQGPEKGGQQQQQKKRCGREGA